MGRLWIVLIMVALTSACAPSKKWKDPSLTDKMEDQQPAVEEPAQPEEDQLPGIQVSTGASPVEGSQITAMVSVSGESTVSQGYSVYARVDMSTSTN